MDGAIQTVSGVWWREGETARESKELDKVKAVAGIRQ